MAIIMGLPASPVLSAQFLSIPLAEIEPDSNQARKEFRDEPMRALIRSIQEDGLRRPIVVTKVDEKKYRIIDGERRYRVHKKFEIEYIPAMIIDNQNAEQGILDYFLSEEYNPVEIAEALARLKRALGDETTDEVLAKRVGKKRSTISEYLSLLKLPDEILHHARENSQVPFRALKVLSAKKIDSKEKVKKYFELHEHHSASQATDASRLEIGNASSADDKPEKLSPQVKRIKRASKKVEAITESINKSFSRLDFNNVDLNIKKEFVDKLKETAARVKELIDKYDMDEINVDASTSDTVES